MQVTCLVLVLPRVVARGGAEKGAGKGRHKLRDSGGWELKTVKTWAFADLTLLLFSLAGNTENKYKKANTMNVASGSVFNKTMAQWCFSFLSNGHIIFRKLNMLLTAS